MKTQIKTTSLLKLINPFEEGIVFKNHKILLDINTLQNYVDFPKKNKIFEKSDDVTINFYKNLALYIINHLDDNQCVSLDFNQETPIQEGIFEYIKAIYLKQANVYISLPSTSNNISNNSLFIDTHKLTSSHELDFAKDIELAQLNSFFSPPDTSFTKLLSNKNTNRSPVDVIPESLSSTVVENDRFFWKADSIDLYSDSSFILNKIKTILTEEKNFDYKYAFIKLKELFNKIPPEYSFPQNFQEDLIPLLNDKVSQFLPLFLSPENKNRFNIDLKSEFIHTKLLEDIKNSQFHLLSFIFSYYIKESFEKQQKNKGYYDSLKINCAEINQNYDLSFFINMPETISYLTKQSISDLLLKEQTNFCLIHAYDFFNDHNKNDLLIIKKFISSLVFVINNKFSHSSYENHFLKLPLEIFNDENHLTSILPYINVSNLRKELKKENLTNNLLIDPEYLLRYIDYHLKKFNNSNNNTRYFENHILDVLNNLIDPHLITQQHLLSLITIFPPLLSSFIERNMEFNKIISPLFNDINFLRDINAKQQNLKITIFPSLLMKPHLLIDDTNLDNEKFKLQYVFAKQFLQDKFNKKSLQLSEIELKQFNAKYNKLEYLYLNTNNYAKSNLSRGKKLLKIKSINELTLLLDKIQNISLHIFATFDSSAFYKELNPILKKQLETIKLINKYGGINYSELDESLQFNKKLAIEFLKQDFSIVNKIPHEFFNDIDFSLSFVKIIDEQHINIFSAPTFISKFFENQGVTDNYYDYLKSYIGMNILKNNLSDKETHPIIKKNKI